MRRVQPIRLTLLADALDADGLPLAALVVPAEPGAAQRRPILRVFASIALAVAAKAEMEARP